MRSEAFDVTTCSVDICVGLFYNQRELIILEFDMDKERCEKISVILPMYNVERYIGKCITSLLNQTHSNMEIIIVDDGSTDLSKQKSCEYADIYPNVVVLDNEKKGLVSAWKTGLKKASGDYIGFVDPDDYVDNDYYKKLCDAITKCDADIAVSGWIREDDAGNVIDKGGMVFAPETVDGEALEKAKQRFFYDRKIPNSRWCKLYKKSIIMQNIDLYDDRISVGEDIGISACTFFDAKRVVYTASVGYHYVYRSGSITHKFNEKALEDFNCLCHEIPDICKEKGYSEKYAYTELKRLIVTVVNMICRSGDKNAKDIMRHFRQEPSVATVMANKAKLPKGILKKAVYLAFRMRMYSLLIIGKKLLG